MLSITDRVPAGSRAERCIRCIGFAKSSRPYRTRSRGQAHRRGGQPLLYADAERGSADCAACAAFQQGVADSTLVGIRKPDELLAVREYAQDTFTAMMYLEGLWHGATAVEN